jgi:hypothetical protein
MLEWFGYDTKSGLDPGRVQEFLKEYVEALNPVPKKISNNMSQETPIADDTDNMTPQAGVGVQGVDQSTEAYGTGTTPVLPTVEARTGISKSEQEPWPWPTSESMAGMRPAVSNVSNETTRQVEVPTVAKAASSQSSETAPADSTTVEAGQVSSGESVRGLTPRAEALLSSVDQGGVPMMITENFKAILKENEIKSATTNVVSNAQPASPSSQPPEAPSGVPPSNEEAKVGVPPDTDDPEKAKEVADIKAAMAAIAFEAGLNPDMESEEIKAKLIELAKASNTYDDSMDNLPGKEIFEAMAKKRLVTTTKPSDAETERPPLDFPSPQDNKGAPAAAEKPVPAKEISGAVLEKFEKTFAGLTKAELEKIPGFTELSAGQQLLVFERMRNVANEDIKKEQVSRYREEIDKLSKSDSFWDNVKNIAQRGWMRATKQWQLGKMKDEATAEWLKATDTNALAKKRESLEALTEDVLRNKEFAVAEKNGSLEVQYLEAESFPKGKIDPERIAEFNRIANEYAHTALGGGEDQEEILKIRRNDFEKAAREMTRLLAESEGGTWSGSNAAEWRTKLEASIQMSRFMDSNPEAAEELEKSGKNLGAAIGLKNLLIERGAYMAGSAGLRIAGVAAMGLVAAPVVAALGGGFMGYRRTKQEFSENDLLAVMQEDEKSKKTDAAEKKPDSANELAKNVVSGEVLVSKLAALAEEYKNASQEKVKSVAARDENGRIRMRDTMDEEGRGIVMEEVSEKEALRRSLEARITYTRRKLEEQLVNLGKDPGERAESMSAIAIALGKAEAELGFSDEGVNAIETRLDNILDIREEKIDSNRKKHIVTQVIKGAALGAAFSAAGLAVGQGVRSLMGGGGGSEVAKDALTDSSEGAAGIVAPDEHPAIPESFRNAIENFNLPRQETGAGIEALKEMVTVERGNTLTGILAKEMGMTPEQAYRALLNIRGDAGALEKLGIRPEDIEKYGADAIDHIYPGQKINVAYFNELLGKSGGGPVPTGGVESPLSELERVELPGYGPVKTVDLTAPETASAVQGEDIAPTGGPSRVDEVVQPGGSKVTNEGAEAVVAPRDPKPVEDIAPQQRQAPQEINDPRVQKAVYEQGTGNKVAVALEQPAGGSTFEGKFSAFYEQFRGDQRLAGVLDQQKAVWEQQEAGWVNNRMNVETNWNNHIQNLRLMQEQIKAQQDGRVTGEAVRNIAGRLFGKQPMDLKSLGITAADVERNKFVILQNIEDQIKFAERQMADDVARNAEAESVQRLLIGAQLEQQRLQTLAALVREKGGMAGEIDIATNRLGVMQQLAGEKHSWLMQQINARAQYTATLNQLAMAKADYLRQQVGQAGFGSAIGQRYPGQAIGPAAEQYYQLQQQWDQQAKLAEIQFKSELVRIERGIEGVNAKARQLGVPSGGAGKGT